MVDQLVIPDDAVKYILFQRTAFLRLPYTRTYRALSRILPGSIYNRAVAIEAVFSRTRVKSLYREEMHREYMSIKPFLPPRCLRALDIGCGVAGLDFFICQHYRNHPIELYLLDKTHVESHVYYMFEPKGAFYNSLAVAKSLLTGSGIDGSSIHLIEASDNNEIQVTRKVDLVVSLLSWGFHYPLPTYLDGVCNILAEDGVVILDIRRNTDGRAVLKRKFAEIHVIMECPKYWRVAARNCQVGKSMAP